MVARYYIVVRDRVPTTSCAARATAALLLLVGSGFCPDSGAAAQATSRQRYDAILRSFRETIEKPPAVPLLPAESAWSLKLGAPPSAPAVMDDQHVYVPVRDYLLVALHRETGLLAWTWAGDTVLSLATGGGDLFLVTPGELRALDAATGYERWSIPMAAGVTAPLFWQEGRLVASVEPGDLIALGALDGQLAWRRRLGAVTGHPAATDRERAVYLTLADGRVVAVALETGEPLWERRLPGTLSPPAAARDRVFVGSTDNFFYAFDAATGREEWKWRNGGDVIGAAVDGDTVYFASLDNIIRAVNRGNGNQRWRKPTGTRPLLPPQAFRGAVVVPGVMPAMTVFAGDTGAAMGTQSAPGDLVGPPVIDPAVPPFRVAFVTVTREGIVDAFRPTSLMFREAAPGAVGALPGRALARERID